MGARTRRAIPVVPAGIRFVRDNYKRFARGRTLVKPLLTDIARRAVQVARKRALSYTATAVEEKKQKKNPKVGTTAHYRGRFTNRRFPSKRGSAQTKPDNYYSRYGVTDTVEISGTVSDPNCVYIGHSSFSALRFLESAMCAMYRKLYVKAIGYDLSSIEDIIPYKNGQSDGHTLHLYWRNHDGTIGSTYNAVGLNTHIRALTASSNPIMVEILKLAYERREGLRIAIMDNDTNLMRATLDLTSLKMDYKFKSEMKIQNVTVPIAADNEADDVNNQPLVGRNYEFKNWHPEISAINAFQKSAITPKILVDEFKGITLVRAAQLGNDWAEPPVPATFRNVSKSSKIRLQPGSIKSDWLIGGGTISFNGLIKALDLDYELTPTTTFHVRIGKHSMVALEKVISIAGHLPIKCFYEVNHFLGVSCVPGMKHGTIGSFYQTTQDNVIP